jgi:hypothetical protein
MTTMPIIQRVWITALIVCGIAGSAALILSGSDRAYAAVATGQVLAVPSPSPSLPAGTSPPAGWSATSPSSSPSPGAPSPAFSPGLDPSSRPSEGGSAGGGSAGGCGWFDVACEFRQAINGFFRGIVSSALNPVFRFLAGSVLSTPRIDRVDRVHSLWTTSVWIADTCFVLLVVAGGILLMGHQSLQTSYTAKDVGPRLIMAMVAANVNLPLIGQGIEFANALSRAFMGQGVDETQAANTLKGLVLHELTDGADMFTSILAMVAVVAGLMVLFTFATRAMMLVLLTVAAPLALACHALPHTEGLARLWWRALAGVLCIQVAQALVFATAMRVFFTSDQTDLFGFRSGKGFFDLVLVICLLYIMARIPAWVSRMTFRGGMSRSPLARIVRTLAAVLIFRRVSGGGAGRAYARTPPGPPPPPPPTVPVTPVVPPPPSPPSWAQPQLPFPPQPPTTGTQLQLPLHPPPKPRPAYPAATQLRLPGVSTPPHWQQTTLPIRPRFTQTRLPASSTRAHVQPELPLAFPPPGSPQAGRSPRRLADTTALRDAEARARRRPVPNSSPPSRRNP